MIDREDRRPICIYHEGDRKAYYSATVEEQDAWNDYAQAEADRFDSNPHLDSYDSTRTYPGFNRDGEYTPWAPKKFFPEWLAERKSR